MLNLSLLLPRKSLLSVHAVPNSTPLLQLHLKEAGTLTKALRHAKISVPASQSPSPLLRRLVLHLCSVTASIASSCICNVWCKALLMQTKFKRTLRL